jgi:hypothetical protein
MRKTGIILSFLFAGQLAWAQLAPEKAAWNNLGRERWIKVRQFLDKALRKDSTNVGANFTYSWYFFTQGNPQFHLDSSYVYLQKVKRDFSLLTKSEKQKLEWYPITDKEIERLQSYQDSAAFERAFVANTEMAYGYFIQQFTWAKQVSRARELQIEVGFLMALRRNTHEAFAEFLQKYPASYRATEAKNRFEKLLYEFETASGRLQAYETFYEQYKDSPYRKEAAQKIFILSTLAGDSLSFVKFINKWKHGEQVEFAKEIVQNLHKKDETEETVFPVWQKQQYSLLKTDGTLSSSPTLKELEKELQCEGISTYFFLSGDKVFTIHGKLLTREAKGINPMEAGFVVVEKEKANEVWHLAGNKLFESNGALELLAGKWWLEKKDGKQTVYSLLGYPLLTGDWRKVLAFDGWLALQTETSWQLVSFSDVADVNNQHKKTIAAEEVKPFKQGIWYKTGNQEALLSVNGKYLVTQQAAKIDLYDGGIAVTRDSLSTLFIRNKEVNKDVKNLKWLKPFWVFQKNNRYAYLNSDHSSIFNFDFDTIQVYGQKLIGFKKDSVEVVYNHQKIYYARHLVKELLSKNDSVYFVLKRADKQYVANVLGQNLFILDADKISYLGGNFFLKSKKEKQWIVNRKGQILIELSADMQASVRSNFIVLVQKNKFGLLGDAVGQLIKPKFEKGIVPLLNQQLLVFQSNRYYLVNWNYKNLPTQFWEDYEIINEQYIWFKKGFYWHVFDLKKSKVVISNISDYKLVKQNSNDAYFVFRQDSQLGLWHTQMGILLEPLFSNIQIKGNDANFIIAQKEVEEAGLILLFVYDQTGKQILKEVYEEKDFDEAICD